MAEPNNGQQPTPDLKIYVEADILQMPNKSIVMRCHAVQNNKTVCTVEVWGTSLDAVIIGAQGAWKKAQEAKSGIVLPK